MIIEAGTGKLVKSLKFDEYPSTLFINDENRLLICFKGKLQEFDFSDGRLLSSNLFDTEVINDVKSDMSAILGHTLTEINVFNKKDNYIKYNVYMMPASNYIITNPKNNYYAANPNATKLLHYVTNDLKVNTFEQLDVKYNRPNKVLEAIGSTDTTLINSYKKAYYKRLKKLEIDTTSFEEGYSVPESDFKNRDDIEYEQKNEELKLVIYGVDSTYKLDRFNVWINEIPLYGKRGISIRNRKTNQLDTTLTVQLSQGENLIETSIMNVNGTESYRMPLYVNYSPISPANEKVRFIGIGIDKFADSTYNLRYSAKDIRDLAKKLKEKYGENIEIDTLLNQHVTVDAIKALKKKSLTTNVNDKVIISYSGHGMLSKDFDYYLSTYSVNFNQPEENGLSYDDLESLLDSIPARNKCLQRR